MSFAKPKVVVFSNCGSFISKFVLILMLVLLALPSKAQSVEVLTSWEANIGDSTVGYKLYCGTSSSDYDEIYDVGNDTSFTLSDREDGKTYFFSATAYDDNNNESDFANEVSITIPHLIDQEPDGEIETPNSNQTIAVGDSVNFIGTGIDPDNNLPLTYSWDFGDSTIPNSTSDTPGQISFNNPGVFNVTFTVANGIGLSDSTPATVKITVNSNSLCTLDSRFEQATLNNGIEYYTDRTYTLTSVPSQYSGFDMIKTPNADRGLTSAADYLTFELQDDTKVYIAFDRRAKSLPDWMNEFTDTGKTIKTSLSSQDYLKIYSKDYFAGECVKLGHNKGPGYPGGTISNYIVFYELYSDSLCTLDSRFEQSTLDNGIGYYTDRTYTLTSVPSQYSGFDMIKTPNADRGLTSAADYLTFELQDDTKVYIAFDRRAKSLPDWMNAFSDTGKTIKTSLDSQGYLKVYSKNYSAGACVKLGHNKGPGYPGGTISNYIVFYELYSGNQEPDGEIETPNSNQTIVVGDSVNFVGAGIDPDNNLPLTYLWDFGDSAIPDSTSDTPGRISFNNPGVFNVTFTVTNDIDISDSTPATVRITVKSNSSCTLDPRFEQSTLDNGIEYYTDRTYTLTSVPSQYRGFDMIKAPNADRGLTSAADYLTFELQNDTKVYVAFDRRAESLPDWMKEFVDTGKTIKTSLSSQGYLKVYSKNYSAGECVGLGHNKGPGYPGGTISNYIVFY